MEANVIARLAGAAGSYTGSGVNHDGEPFTAELTLDQVAGGMPGGDFAERSPVVLRRR
jgi:hypothetical protein